MAVKFPTEILDLIDVSLIEDEYFFVVIDHREGTETEFDNPKDTMEMLRGLIRERNGDIVAINERIRRQESKELTELTIRAFNNNKANSFFEDRLSVYVSKTVANSVWHEKQQKGEKNERPL